MIRLLPCIAMLIGLTANAQAVGPPFDCVIDPSETLKLGSPITGILAQVLIKRGDVVVRGQPIAILESSVEASTVRLNKFRAESTARIDAQTERLNLARARLDRNAQLFDRKIVSQDRFEELRAESRVAEQDLLREQQERQLSQLELERSQAILEQRTIRSTIDGIVNDKKLSAGEFVNQEGYIATLARLDPLHVEVFVPVIYFQKLKIGMTAKVYPAPPIDGMIEATVTVIDRVFDPASGTFGVRLALPNPGNLLPGGQRCKVSFDIDAATPATR